MLNRTNFIMGGEIIAVPIDPNIDRKFLASQSVISFFDTNITDRPANQGTVGGYLVKDTDISFSAIKSGYSNHVSYFAWKENGKEMEVYEIKTAQGTLAPVCNKLDPESEDAKRINQACEVNSLIHNEFKKSAALFIDKNALGIVKRATAEAVDILVRTKINGDDTNKPLPLADLGIYNGSSDTGYAIAMSGASRYRHNLGS